MCTSLLSRTFRTDSLIGVPSAASFVFVVANAFPFSLWGPVIALVEVAFVGVEFASRSDIVSTCGLARGGLSGIDVNAFAISISELASSLSVTVKGRTLSDFGLGGCLLLSLPLPQSPHPSFFSSRVDAVAVDPSWPGPLGTTGRFLLLFNRAGPETNLPGGYSWKNGGCCSPVW